MKNIWRSEFRSYHIPHHTNRQKLRKPKKRSFWRFQAESVRGQGKHGSVRFVQRISGESVMNHKRFMMQVQNQTFHFLLVISVHPGQSVSVNHKSVNGANQTPRPFPPPCINYKQTRTGRGAEGNTMYRNPSTGTESPSVHTGSALCATAWYVIRIRSFRRWRRRIQYEVTVK